MRLFDLQNQFNSQNLSSGGVGIGMTDDRYVAAGAQLVALASDVLVPGAAAPKLVTRNMISRMKQSAVHYCVANMPGAVARTSTLALNNATIGHAVALALGYGYVSADSLLN